MWAMPLAKYVLHVKCLRKKVFKILFIAQTKMWIKFFYLSSKIIGNIILVVDFVNYYFMSHLTNRQCCSIIWIHCYNIDLYAFLVTLHFIVWFVNFIIRPHTSLRLDIDGRVEITQRTPVFVQIRVYLYVELFVDFTLLFYTIKTNQ